MTINWCSDKLKSTSTSCQKWETETVILTVGLNTGRNKCSGHQKMQTQHF